MNTSAPMHCMGSLLGGGYAGYVYGSEGIWQSAVEADFPERSCGDASSSGAPPKPSSTCKALPLSAAPITGRWRPAPMR